MHVTPPPLSTSLNLSLPPSLNLSLHLSPPPLSLPREGMKESLKDAALFSEAGKRLSLCGVPLSLALARLSLSLHDVWPEASEVCWLTALVSFVREGGGAGSSLQVLHSLFPPPHKVALG